MKAEFARPEPNPVPSTEGRYLRSTGRPTARLCCHLVGKPPSPLSRAALRCPAAGERPAAGGDSRRGRGPQPRGLPNPLPRRSGQRPPGSTPKTVPGAGRPSSEGWARVGGRLRGGRGAGIGTFPLRSARPSTARATPPRGTPAGSHRPPAAALTGSCEPARREGISPAGRERPKLRLRPRSCLSTGEHGQDPPPPDSLSGTKSNATGFLPGPPQHPALLWPMGTSTTGCKPIQSFIAV